MQLSRPAFYGLVAAVAMSLGFGAGAVARGWLTPNPSIELPAEVQARPGRLVQLRATSNGPVRWHACSQDLDLFQLGDGSAIASAPAPGRYPVLAWTARGGTPSEAARCVVVVDGPGPVPPPPPPPPPPPVPPVPPEPTDPFYVQLKNVWISDTSPDKRKHRDTLVSFYAQAADLAQQPNLTTLGDLHAVLREAAGKVLPPTALNGLRQAIADELDKRLPTKDAAKMPLDTGLRAKCAAEFQRASEFLGKLP